MLSCQWVYFQWATLDSFPQARVVEFKFLRNTKVSQDILPEAMYAEDLTALKLLSLKF